MARTDPFLSFLLFGQFAFLKRTFVPRLLFSTLEHAFARRLSSALPVMDDLSDFYRILEVGPNASLAEIKQAYRELARVWHPDRFPNDARLQQKAQEKLKQINVAYERICGRGAHEPRRPATSTTGPTPQPRQTTSQWTPPKPSPGAAQSVPPKAQRTSWFWGPVGPPKINWGKVVLFLITAAVISLLVIARISTESTSSTTRAAMTTSSRQPNAFDQFDSTRTVSPRPSLALEPITPSVAPTPLEIRRAQPVNELAPQLGYITIGSTKNDVLRIQGSPDQFTDISFSYGSSHVYFEGDRVTSWVSRFPRLKAQLLPRPGTKTPAFFTVGSSIDEVLAVQGSPDQFADTTFSYGSSHVYFQNGRVATWVNRFPKLKAQLLPRAGTATPPFFTVGSSKDEVLAVQGSPDQFTDTTFSYGSSHVYFQNGRVSS